MRSISFILTPDQILAESKTVTRRTGWRHAKSGMLLQGVRQAQGLKKGQTAEKLKVIRVIGVRFEPLNRVVTDPAYGAREMVLEGFPGMDPSDFVAMVVRANDGCRPTTEVTRIEFEYEREPA